MLCCEEWPKIKKKRERLKQETKYSNKKNKIDVLDLKPFRIYGEGHHPSAAHYATLLISLLLLSLSLVPTNVHHCSLL